MINEKVYSECEKLKDINPQIQILGEFLDYLDKEQIILCVYDGQFLTPYRDKSRSSMISEFFGIDEKKLEEERKEILEELQNSQNEKKNRK